MGVPKGRRTRGKRGSRRSHLRRKPIDLSFCSHCKKPKLPHKMCASCGFYDGKEVVNILARELKKKEKKQKSRK